MHDPGIIHLRLASLAEAFDRLDPAPLPEKRLSPAVMAYVISRAEEAKEDQPLTIVAHLPDDAIGPRRAQILADAFHLCFHQRSDWERDERHEVFRTGRQFMVIGVAVFGLIWLALWGVQQISLSPGLRSFIEDSSVILAWVIIWRPAEIFLYDWLPIRKRRRLFDRIAAAPVRVEPLVDDEWARLTPSRP